MSVATDPAEQEVDAIIADLDPIFEDAPKSGPAAPKQTGRQILIVQTAQLFTASFVLSSASPQPQSQSYIRFLGAPSPSSDVTNGFIRFVPRADQKPPRYNPAAKQINLWVDQDLMALTLAQIKQPNRYLWIGFFANGHVYGDLHSND